MRTRDSAEQRCGSFYDMIDETYLTARKNRDREIRWLEQFSRAEKENTVRLVINWVYVKHASGDRNIVIFLSSTFYTVSVCHIFE